MPGKRAGLIAGGLAAAAVLLAAFQNCGKSSLKDFTLGSPFHSVGLCEPCFDDKGAGITCRASADGPASNCAYESCRPGYELHGNGCEPVTCVSGQRANCLLPHGMGTMTCSHSHFGECVAETCDQGFVLVDGECADAEGGCEPGSQRDCSTESTVGRQTCNSEGRGYGICVFGECQIGYHKEPGGDCQPIPCDPGSERSCEWGVGRGVKMCNIHGNAYSVCSIRSCGEGFKLEGGLCVKR